MDVYTLRPKKNGSPQSKLVKLPSPGAARPGRAGSPELKRTSALNTVKLTVAVPLVPELTAERFVEVVGQ